MDVSYVKGNEANPLRGATSGNPEVENITAFWAVTVHHEAEMLTPSDVGETTATLTTNYAGAWCTRAITSTPPARRLRRERQRRP